MDQRDPLGARLTLLLGAVLGLVVPFAVLLSLVEARWEPLRAADATVTAAVYDLVTEHAALVVVMQAVSDVGGGRTWWVLLTATAIYLLVRRRPRAALFVAVTGAGGGLLNVAAKALVNRARPDLFDPVSYASGFAFPSGHTMSSAIGVSVLLVVFLPVLPRAGQLVAVAVGTMFALAVGVSRVVLGVHWASDVVGGWLLAAAWVLAMLAAFGPWDHVGADPAPAVSTGAVRG